MAIDEENRDSHIRQPLLSVSSEGAQSFTFPLSAPDSRRVSLDANETTGVNFARGNSFRKEDWTHEETPRPFRGNSFRFRDGDDDSENVSKDDNVAKVDSSGEKKKRAKRRSLRNPIAKKSLVRQAAYSATNHPVFFMKNLLWGLILWPKWTWDALASQMTLTIISFKTGLAAGLASIICVVELPPAYTELATSAVWAVVTIDLLYEGNIGLSLSKGVNRVAGTLAAGAAAVFLTQLSPDVPDYLYPYYIVFWVFVGGFTFRFLKGIPPLKDQWGYAFTVATIAFHILLLNAYLQPERVTLPLLRFAMILLGFFLASIINLAFQPVYAGDALHKLVAKNFDTAADILQRCVTEYVNFTMLDHVPDILSGRSEDDKIHQSYHEIVMSDSDIDKLLGAVCWEPCHDAFFNGYPWHLYDDITDYLRYTLYDVIALDSCLRASIQAPKDLRDLFSKDMKLIAEECSNVLHILGESMRTMTTFESTDILCKAEEAAIKLQNKIYVNTHLLLGKRAAESPRYGFYVSSSPNLPGRFRDYSAKHSESYNPNDPWATFALEQLDSENPDERKSTPPVYAGNGVSVQQYTDRAWGDEVSANGHPSKAADSRVYAEQQDVQSSPGSSWYEGGFLSRASSMYYGPGGLLESPNDSSEVLHYLRRDSQSTLDGIIVEELGDRSGATEEQVGGADEQAKKVKTSRKPSKSWKFTFKKRRSNLGTDYEWAEERISALSLVKFASLLIEVVVKMEYIVTSVIELGVAAKFKTHVSDDPSLRVWGKDEELGSS